MSPCSCIVEDKFNFTIDYRNKENLILFTDNSEFITADHLEPQKEYELIIKNEASNLEATVKVGIGVTTLIPYSILSTISTQDCGIDGIYKFRVESCGLTLQRSEAVIPTIHCAYTQLLLKPNKVQQDYDNIQNVFFEMEYLKAAAREKLLEQASEHFQILSKIINNLNCQCDD